MTRRIALMLSTTVLLFASEAQAQFVNWIQWDSAYSVGAPGGSATGSSTTSPWYWVNVIYNGELQSLQFGYPNWTPPFTFDAGGPFTPLPSQGMIGIMGGSSNTNTITFSNTVINPAIAFWSLGSPEVLAEFVFDQPFFLASGGPNDEYGGSSIVQESWNIVTGLEGNGVIIFPGMYDSISWSNPLFESYYGFTVGFEAIPVCAGTSPSCIPDPEPLSLALLGSGLAGLALLRRRRR